MKIHRPPMAAEGAARRRLKVPPEGG